MKYLLTGFFLFVLLAVLYVVRPIPFVKRSDMAISVAPSNLRSHVELLSTTYSPRSWDSIEGTRQTVSYIEKHFQAMGAKVGKQRFSIGEREIENVIARYGESGPLLVVGAHYDTYGDTPGADDNASGVAGVLELARILNRFPIPGVRIELVAFATEEPPHFTTPLMGSAQYVASLVESGEKPELTVILEMIGYFSDEPDSQRYPVRFLTWVYPSVGNFIGVIGNFGFFSPTCYVKARMMEASKLPVYSINAPRIVPGIDFSDHRNFWDAGFPAVMITDTADFRNLNYHQVTDTASTLDYSRMAEVVGGVYSVLKGYS